MRHPTNRAERRHHSARAKARAARRLRRERRRGDWYNGPQGDPLREPFAADRSTDPRVVGIQAKTRTLCSCEMCSPRKWDNAPRHADRRQAPVSPLMGMQRLTFAEPPSRKSATARNGVAR